MTEPTKSAGRRVTPARWWGVPFLGALLVAALSLTTGPGGAVASPSTLASSGVPAAQVGDEICLSARIPEGGATVCAERDRFAVDWELTVTDTEDDGRDVAASIALDVTDARDPRASLRNGLGVGTSTHSRGSFRPRFGSAIGNLDLSICVDIRFLPDRCHTESTPIPQLASQASPEQAARLEELVFDLPLAAFIETWADGDRNGVDKDFDWTSDGCSAGPVAPVFGEFLEPACLRHDFAYRNYGQLGYDPSDEIRRRVDEQLAADAETLGRGDISGGLTWALQRFAAPVFFGEELADVWGVPTYLASWLRTAPNDGSAE
jgi:hypothetical protein